VLLLLFGAAMAAGAAWLLERLNREPTDVKLPTGDYGKAGEGLQITLRTSDVNLPQRAAA
jgi:hypothetical protein